MKIKADDYFNNGLFEMARFGKHTFMKNIMTPSQHQRYVKSLKLDYIELKKEIDSLISIIRDKVTQCNPIRLLSFSADMFLVGQLGVQSEIQFPGEDIPTARMTEYIQSILVSSPNNFIDKGEEIDPSEMFFSIQIDLNRLYSLINHFYFCWGARLRDEHPEWDETIIMTVVESQMLFLVRGQRYQVFEIEYFEKLLFVHNDIFKKLFELSASDIVEGIKKLQYSLSQGKLDAMNKIGKLFDEFSNNECMDQEKFFEEHREEGNEFFDEFFGTKLRDVLMITGWNEKFVKELSYGLNEEQKFFDNSEFTGWPVIDLPIQKRPFIKLNDKYYCFDYYSIMDNFYRSIQKTVTRLAPDYLWADQQQNASEKMVESIFKQLLPGCLIYHENYYPQNGSIKQAAENDLLVLYSNVLIIAEVKAGSFAYTPPLTDFEAHIKSYKALIEKADWQCKRTYDYLTSIDMPYIYNKEHKIKAQIDMSTITDIYMMSVTVDNINDFAARAEKLNFLQLQCNAISISVDDLMVYREYFKSPLCFLHFLKQRKLATQEEKIALNDELDHLGMYIAHNCYTFQADLVPRNTHIKFYGYRENLDNYFCSLYHPQLHPEKPLPNIPDLFLRIINYLEDEVISNRVEISNYLLDFSSEAKEELCNQVKYALKRQLQTKYQAVFIAAGTGDSLRYSCFVNQPGITQLSDDEKRKHVLATLIWNSDPERVLIDLYFDENEVFCKLIFKHFTSNDIQDDEFEELRAQGEKLANMRLEKYKLMHSGKIGRNELCPCGSGKKYKRCCGC